MTILTKNIELMKAEAARHIAADAVMSGQYWRPADNAVGGNGCFIGCLTHGSNAEGVQGRFGLPLPSVRIAEHIFERLPKNEQPKFFEAVPEAIGKDGRDLTRVHWVFLENLLRNLPELSEEHATAVREAIAGLRLLAAGKEWPKEQIEAARATVDPLSTDPALAAFHACAHIAEAASHAGATGGAYSGAAVYVADAAGYVTAAAKCVAGAAFYAADAADYAADPPIMPPIIPPIMSPIIVQSKSSASAKRFWRRSEMLEGSRR